MATAARAPETEALYREHGAAVAAFCRSLLRDRGEAEDATQQVFLSAHRALLNGTTPQEPLAWLLAVARNECYARFRRRAATAVPAGEAADGATADASVHVLRAGELATMWDEVEQMPRAQREAFLLREIRGLSYGQLAAELSVSASSVRSLLLRARTRLRHRLGDVAAGLGGAQWVQALLRVTGGGDGQTPVPAAAKAVAVGLGALALAGGDGLQPDRHHAPPPRVQATAQHRSEARARAAVVPAIAATVPAREVRSRLDSSGSTHPPRHEARSSGPGSGSGSGSGGADGSHRSSDDLAVSASGPTTGSGRDGGGSSTQSGSTQSGSGTSGSSGETTTTTTAQSSSDGVSDGGSGSVTTTTTTTTSSSGSDSSHSDGSGSSGMDGSDSSDGSSGHGG